MRSTSKLTAKDLKAGLGHGSIGLLGRRNLTKPRSIMSLRVMSMDPHLLVHVATSFTPLPLSHVTVFRSPLCRPIVLTNSEGAWSD